jgi:hypothetical protein
MESEGAELLGTTGDFVGLATRLGPRFGVKWGDGCSTGDTRRVRTGRAQEVEVIVSAFA